MQGFRVRVWEHSKTSRLGNPSRSHHINHRTSHENNADGVSPKGPCTQIVQTRTPKYPNGDYFKAKVYLFGNMDP